MIRTVLLALLFSSCTLNITQTDTHGWAEDVVDTTTEDQVEADLSVPVHGL